MRRIAKLVIGIGACVALSVGLAACDQASAKVTQWQGLCIPSARITSLQGTAFGEAFSHMKTDVSTAPEVVLEFSSGELAQAIPGYIPEIPGKFGTNMGSVVTIQPLSDASRPGGAVHMSQGDRNLWNLAGSWKNSTVLKISDTDLYRVTDSADQKYDSYFVLVTRDLRKTGGKPVPPPNEWYVADCGQSDELGYTCTRNLVVETFYIEYNFAKPNVDKLPGLDEFFRNKLKEWQATCESR